METNWKFILQESETHYYCVICGCEISGSRNAEGHFRGRYHADAIEEYGDDISYSGDNQYYCQLCDCYISGYQNVRVHFRGKQHQGCLYGSDTESSEDDSEDYVALSSRDFIIDYSDNSYMFYCCLCNINITNMWHIPSHLGCQNHKIAVTIYGSDILGNGSTWYYCRLCDCSINSYKNVYEHITGRRHDNFLDELE
ncbi:UBP1-associated proteins 1C [Cephus cinctus]|uniref:UBP1-associated proteins 1C n=1 Tax=Cephus cinctus TaxID=211228 RepID=A0AAJ7VWB7_CEPCN|nr:UBP1-associated proteins 1C [Cephus cinctus]XP_024935613.1 UBP1-associated proteins 1C [Cephus cinctus]